jgi:hypothetical protein
LAMKAYKMHHSSIAKDVTAHTARRCESSVTRALACFDKGCRMNRSSTGKQAKSG